MPYMLAVCLAYLPAKSGEHCNVAILDVEPGLPQLTILLKDTG